MSIYVDTSVVVALLTNEPKTPEVVSWYTGLQEIPIAADWLLTEFSSAVSLKIRTGQLSEANAKLVRKEFDQFVEGGIRFAQVSREAFRNTGVMIEQHQDGLRAGDSLHLAVAMELGVTHMATLDGNLAKNADQRGLEIIGF